MGGDLRVGGVLPSTHAEYTTPVTGSTANCTRVWGHIKRILAVPKRRTPNVSFGVCLRQKTCSCLTVQYSLSPVDASTSTKNALQCSYRAFLFQIWTCAIAASVVRSVIQDAPSRWPDTNLIQALSKVARCYFGSICCVVCMRFAFVHTLYD